MTIEYSFSPSELDYKAKKCSRCFYIHKHNKICLLYTSDAADE